jgi:glycosyltransferase involved in cell wall biosynthesis
VSEQKETSFDGTGPTTAPLVSVIIPAYNCSSYIAAALDSVLAQTMSDYEIIVVNDGSLDTPELERVLQPYAASIRYIKQANGGASAARNTAVRAARGRYLAFLDSDDIWLPHHLEHQTRLLLQDPSLGLVYSNGVRVKDDRLIAIAFDETPQSLPVNTVSLLLEKATVNTSSTVVIREAVVAAGLFDEQLKRCEDVDLWLRLAQRGVGITFSREVQIAHRLANGLAASGDLMKQALVAVYKKILATHNLPEEQSAIIQQRIAAVSVALYFERAKESLLLGKFDEANENIGQARRLGPNWRVRATHLGLRFFPKLLQYLYGMNLRRVERRKRIFRENSLRTAGFSGFTVDLLLPKRASRPDQINAASGEPELHVQSK